MEDNPYSNTLWSRLLVDQQMRIVEILNFDEKLFFGRHPMLGQTIAEAAGSVNHQQAERIVKEIEKAHQQQRNTFFTYLSRDSQINETQISVHIELRKDQSVCLYLTPILQEDLLAEVRNISKTKTLEFIYEDLPIGVEIYDRYGQLIEMNTKALRDLGIKNKEEVLGVLLFDNPFLPKEMKKKLLSGESVHFTIGYNFNELKNYYNSSRKDLVHLDVTISVLQNQAGEPDKYIVVSQEITDLILLRNKYETLYQQNHTILNSLPIGIGLYSNEGFVQYMNDQVYEILGIDKQTTKHQPININDNPLIPQSIKNAIATRTPIHIHFPYNFDKLKGVNDTLSQKKTIEIECQGYYLTKNTEDTDLYILILNDITQKIESDELLRQSHKKTEIAMQAADIIFWEYDVQEQLFYSDNDPINGYDRSRPLTIEQYLSTVHPDNFGKANGILERMIVGENLSETFDIQVLFPSNPEWQYCSIQSSPYEYGEDGRVLKYVGTRKNNTYLQKRKLLQDKILDSIPLSILIKDVKDSFRYAFCNKESKKLFGTTEEISMFDIMDEENAKRIQQNDLEVFNTGKPYFGLEHVILKDGRKYEVIVQKSIIEDGGKQMLLSIRWDQSLQNELKRRSKLFSLTLEAMNAFMWLYDPDKKQFNFGDGFDKVRGNSSEIEALSAFMACIHPDDISSFTNSLERILTKESGTWKWEYRIDLNGDGIYTWWETRGILETSILNDIPHKYIFGMTLCIEPHKQIEMTLRKNKEELSHLIRQNELILNNTNSGLAYVSTDYIVQWENISICSTSLSLEAYKKGERCYKSTHNRTTPCENCVLQRTLRSRQVEQIQFTLENNRRVEIFATPVFNNKGAIEGIVIRLDDITEREKMIEELKKAKVLAEQSDKFKSNFLANMSHEIRTPLNAIVGFSELLTNTTDPAEKSEYIKIISNNNNLLLNLINDILDLSKIEAGAVEFMYEEFELVEYFNDMTASMRQRITNSNVRLLTTNPYTECWVSLDKNRLAQLITNYVTNAIKYTPKGFIEMGYECTETDIRFYVKDSGIGIPDEKKNKVFHRFAKLDEFAQGTGLGLSICRAIAQSMNGHVGFESEYGVGSTFWVSLPCTPKITTQTSVLTIDSSQEDNCSVNEKKSAMGDESATCFERQTILIVEDIYSNYLLLSILLRNDFNLLHALNGEQAIEFVKNNDIALVLMDMKMPVMDGMKATAEIRKFNKELPIIALTAHAFESDRAAALKAGCNDYLVKPIDKVRLMTVLQQYCPTTPHSKEK